MRVDARAAIGTAGAVLCVFALAGVRSAHLYDEKFDENLGMSWTTALVLLGAVTAFWTLPKSTVHEKWRGAALAAAGLALAVVLFVAAHPDDTCVLGCGPF